MANDPFNLYGGKPSQLTQDQKPSSPTVSIPANGSSSDPLGLYGKGTSTIKSPVTPTQQPLDVAKSIFGLSTPGTPGLSSRGVDLTQSTLSFLNTLRKNVTDVFSGAAEAKAAQSSSDPLSKLVGNAAQKWFDTVGSKLYLNDTDAKAASDELKKNPNYWDSLGAAFNVASTPFLLHDLATAGAKVLGKELPLPAMVSDTFSIVNHAIPSAIATGIGKTIQNTFGKFSNAALESHLPWAQNALKDSAMGIKDLASQEGRHVIDWVQRTAEKIHFARGGDEVSKLSNSDIQQAWSEAVNVFGTNLKDISRNMDTFAKTMNRVVGGVQNIGSTLGLDPSLTENLTLYTEDYMQAAKTAATKGGKPSPAFVDQLTSILDSVKKSGALARTDIGKFEDYIKAIKLVEKDTGYKVGNGHFTFVDPATLEEIPKAVLPSEIGAGASTVGKAIKETPLTRIFNTIKGVIDPQVFTNDAKQALVQSRFRVELQKSGLDPVDVLKKITAFRGSGEDISTGDPGNIFTKGGAGAFRKVFGDDANKVIDAAAEASKLPFKISGLSTAQIARRIPYTSPLVQALFGLRWRVNPVFQLAKLPTKLYEIAAAEGLTPGSPEVTNAVAHYAQTYDKPMLSRIIDNFDTELQYQGSAYSKWAKSIMSNTQNLAGDKGVVAGTKYAINKTANFIDHIATADEKVYAKAVYKYLSDKGYDLTSVPIETQIDHVIKNVPMDVLGAADNYAKTLTKYGQGTSPLQNTLNTIFFPLLFHMKVAKFAVAGTLRFPEVANAVGQLVNIQNKWALSPEGQQWHRTPGLPQFMAHLAGSAEPVNIPALTGRDESLKQQAAGFATPYNPLAFLAQGAADVTGLQIPGTQPPTSNQEIKAPIPSAIAAGTGMGSVFSQLDKLQQATGLAKPAYTPTIKSLKAEIARQQAGKLPLSKSLITSMRNFQGTDTLSQTQKVEYARMRASYDFPDDKAKQQKEIDYIVNLWKRVRPAKK